MILAGLQFSLKILHHHPWEDMFGGVGLGVTSTHQRNSPKSPPACGVDSVDPTRPPELQGARAETRLSVGAGAGKTGNEGINKLLLLTTPVANPGS